MASVSKDRPGGLSYFCIQPEYTAGRCHSLAGTSVKRPSRFDSENLSSNFVMSQELIRFDDATVTRPGGDAVFTGLNWTLRSGETWAIVGPVGAGKSTFAEALLGRYPVRAGRASWPIVQLAPPAQFPAEVIKLVGFKEESRLFSYRNHYYQERFNFTDPLEDITLGAFLQTGLKTSYDAVSSIATRLGVGELLDKSFLTLSNGQVRRARIARALLTEPELLVLDDPFMGLDGIGRAEVEKLLRELVHHGTRIVLITRPEAVPGWVTHVLELEALTVKWSGVIGEWIRPHTGARSAAFLRNAAQRDALPVIELEQVTVKYGSVTALNDVSWTVRVGDRWAVLGPNGSGKTTLLSLVCGDHPQAYGNAVRVFGRQRGTGESIWEVKKRIGLVSPELHLYFTQPMTARQAAGTGFHDVVTPRPLTAEQHTIIERFFTEFRLTEVSATPFARLSTGQQRLVLLVRALVKSPEILILDEPFQGLDAPMRDLARGWLDENLRVDQTLVFVTHHLEELPLCVDRVLKLDRGKAHHTSTI